MSETAIAAVSPPMPRIAGVIAPPPALFAGALVGGLLLDRMLPVRLRAFGSARGTIGLGLVLAAAGLGGWAAVEMKRAGTHVVPHQPSTALVTTGPFTQTRNPIYVALAGAYAGLATWFGSLGALLLLPPLLVLVQQGVIAREERYLERIFGDAYRAYRAGVPRWL